MILVAGIAAVLIAVACLAYYIVLGFWVGFGVNFGMIWPAASAVFAGIAALCRRARKGRRVPAWLWIPGLAPSPLTLVSPDLRAIPVPLYT